MKNLLVWSTLALAMAGAFAADKPGTGGVAGMLRVTKPDGSSVVARALLGRQVPTATIRLRAADAQSAADGVCTFALRLDEVSDTARTGVVTQLFAHDTLLAQTASVDLQAKVIASSALQLPLAAGATSLKVVLDATGAQPTTSWVRVSVDGACTPDAPVTPASPGWRALFNAWGYSNYAVKQLKDKGYAGYDTLVAVNADLAKVVQAKSVSQAGYDALMARWNAIANDSAFKAVMATVKPGQPGDGKGDGSAGNGTGTGSTPPATVKPDTPAWRTLFNAWGYSNYAVTQLKGKGFAGYDELVAVNAALRAVVQARSVSQADYDALMARWNAIAANADFKALMAAVVPGKPGEK